MINGCYDYEASKRTSRPSAPKPSGSSSSSGKGTAVMAPASGRRVDRLASGAFNGSGLKGLKINAVDKDKGKEVVDDDKRGEKARRNGKRDVEAAPMPNSGEKDRVQISCRCLHEGQDHGCHCLHGQNAQARQHAHESVEDHVELSKASTCLGANGTSSSDEGGFMRSSKKSARIEVSKPAASDQRLPKGFRKTDNSTGSVKEQRGKRNTEDNTAYAHPTRSYGF